MDKTMIKKFEELLNSCMETNEPKTAYWANTENVKKSLQQATNSNGETRVFLPQTVRVAWFNACNPSAKIKVTLRSYKDGTAWSEAQVITTDGAEANSLASCSIDEDSGFYDAVEGSQIRAVAQCAKFLGYFLPEEISGTIIPSNQQENKPPVDTPQITEMLDEADDVEEPLSEDVQHPEEIQPPKKEIAKKEKPEETSQLNNAVLSATRKATTISEEKKAKLEEMYQDALSNYGSKQLLERCQNTRVEDGKHKNKTLGELLVADISFLNWLVSKKASTTLGKRAYMLLRLNNKEI